MAFAVLLITGGLLRVVPPPPERLLFLGGMTALVGIEWKVELVLYASERWLAWVKGLDGEHVTSANQDAWHSKLRIAKYCAIFLMLKFMLHIKR
jgi:hypothetical protein